MSEACTTPLVPAHSRAYFDYSPISHRPAPERGTRRCLKCGCDLVWASHEPVPRHRPGLTPERDFIECLQRQLSAAKRALVVADGMAQNLKLLVEVKGFAADAEILNEYRAVRREILI